MLQYLLSQRNTQQKLLLQNTTALAKFVLNWSNLGPRNSIGYETLSYCREIYTRCSWLTLMQGLFPREEVGRLALKIIIRNMKVNFNYQ